MELQWSTLHNMSIFQAQAAPLILMRLRILQRSVLSVHVRVFVWPLMTTCMCVSVCVCVCVCPCVCLCVSLCMCVWCMFSIQRTILSAAVCVCAYWTIPRSASQRRRIPLLTLCVAVCYCVSASVGQSRVDRRLSMSCVE